jgi:hypothetical protein
MWKTLTQPTRMPKNTKNVIHISPTQSEKSIHGNCQEKVLGVNIIKEMNRNNGQRSENLC